MERTLILRFGLERLRKAGSGMGGVDIFSLIHQQFRHFEPPQETTKKAGLREFSWTACSAVSWRLRPLKASIYSPIFSLPIVNNRLPNHIRYHHFFYMKEINQHASYKNSSVPTIFFSVTPLLTQSLITHSIVPSLNIKRQDNCDEHSMTAAAN